jgi:RNA polymerase sigma-70 factor (sigma-E family)
MIRRKNLVAAAAADVGHAVGALYDAHYQSLVRLATLVAGCDAGTADEVVQDAFVAMHRHWGRLRGTDKALPYLRQSVLNRSRPASRDRSVVDEHAPKPPPDTPNADHKAAFWPDGPAVMDGLRRLPAPQREALVLRYYADLSEAGTAKIMRISRRAVRTHTVHGMSALRALLEQQP